MWILGDLQAFMASTHSDIGAFAYGKASEGMANRMTAETHGLD
jgi:hypothetical protein